jgi:hypothetical protein
MKNNIEDISLLSNDSSKYGEHFKEHLLAQYLKYIEMADKISERRILTNSFFITLNTGLISALGIFDLFNKSTPLPTIIIVCLATCLLCVYWAKLIQSYSNLNTAKFNVIHEFEKYLPMRPYDYEWDCVGRGTDKKLYHPFSHIEKNIPYIFMALYILIFGFYLLSKICV